LRHYDLDDIAPFEPFLNDLGTEMQRELDALALSAAPVVFERTDQPRQPRGNQIAVHRELTWRVTAGDAAIVVRAVASRFVGATAGVVNNTMELSVRPQSPKSRQARTWLLSALPAVGVLVGLFGWWLLQWDTNMPVFPWALFGALLGLVLAVLLIPRISSFVAVWLEGRGALARRANRAKVNAAACAVVERVAGAHRAQTEARRAAATPQAPPADPAAFAAFAAEFAENPDASLIKFGLLLEPNRTALVNAFHRIEKDPDAYRRYLEARTA
jgi:hypothetical protein